MLGLTLTSLWSRRRRLAGTCIAVFLGVAFLTGTLVLGDTLQANFARLFTDVSAGTDVVVRNATSVDSTSTLDGSRGMIDESLVATVRAVPGVDVAEAQVVGYGSLIGRDGDAIGGNGPPRQAGSWISDPSLNPYQIVEGRAPTRPDEVVVNRGAVKSGDLRLGDTTVVQTPDPVRVHIVGIAAFGDADGLGRTTWTAFTLPSAQANISRKPGQVSTILVRGDPGVDASALRDRIEAALPHGVEAITGARLAEERLDAIDSTFLDMLRTFLVAFAGIALLVATLSINNTFSITVVQRTRELALLRAVGASRRQLRAVVTLEALTVAVASAAVGVVGGLGIAELLKGIFDAFGGALPAGGLTVDAGSLAISFAAGVVVTVLAAQLPARRAARVAPVTALRDADTRSTASLRVRAVAGGVLVVGALAAAAVAVTSGDLLAAAVAGVALVVGSLALAPLLLPPIATAFGAVLFRTRGAPGVLARQNAHRDPRRTAATATALLVGVAVVSLFTTFASSAKATLGDDATGVFRADLAVNTAAFGGSRLSPRIVEELRGRPEVASAIGLGGGSVLLDGETTDVTATNAARVGSLVAIDTSAGRLGDLGTTGIAISSSEATDRGWRLGTAVRATFQDGATVTTRVRAVYDDNVLLGDVVLPSALYSAHTAQPTLRTVLLTTRSGVSVAQARHAVTPIATRFGGDVQDRSEYAGALTEGLDLLLGIVYALLALAVLIALLGLGNTLSLAVHERRREIGLLRAVGETRRQARSALRLESLIVSSFGTLLGLVTGGLLGYVLFATGSDGATLSLPLAQLAIVAVLGALAGLLAAVRPARRAARVPVLDAIADSQ
jgi:putative ABC transport system permease protein